MLSRMRSIRDREYNLAADQIYRFCDDFSTTFAYACDEFNTLEIPKTRDFSANAVCRCTKELQDSFLSSMSNHYSTELKHLPEFKSYGLPLFEYAHNTAKEMCYTAKISQPTSI